MTHLLDSVAAQVRRRQIARQRRRQSMWLGLATPGMIGWTVSVSTVAGLAGGIYLDSRWPGRLSWILTGLGLGLLLGCLQAWRWIDQEHRTMFDDQTSHPSNQPPLDSMTSPQDR